MKKIKLGLIVNPIAGLGGSVGLKGTDGKAKEAIALGSRPKSGERTMEAMKELLPLKDQLLILTGKGKMGNNICRTLGFETKILTNNEENSTSADTVKLGKRIAKEKAKIILFSGGDGTAADLYRAVGNLFPSLGIPAGVKIHSPVYAKSPRAAGILARLFLEGKEIDLREEEVLDIDEELYRKEIISTTLLGYLTIPYKKNYSQSKKAPTSPSEKNSIRSIALKVISKMERDAYYIIGPGTTTRGIMEELKLPCTLIGVDIIKDKKLVAKDVYGEKIMDIVKGKKNKLILTFTGGQGFLFGRGNQQITPEVIKNAGKKNIILIAPPQKLLSLKGESLLTDTSDKELDRELEGYIKVITGYHESILTKIEAP